MALYILQKSNLLNMLLLIRSYMVEKSKNCIPTFVARVKAIKSRLNGCQRQTAHHSVDNYCVKLFLAW